MPITLTETDTAIDDCAGKTACASLTGFGTPMEKRATSGGTAGVTAVTITHAGSSGAQGEGLIRFQSVDNEPNSTSWEAGNWTVRFEVTTANMVLTWNAVYVCRVAGPTGCTNIATVVGTTGLAIGLDTTGVKTTTQSGTSQVANTTDEMLVIVAVTSTSTMAQTFAAKPSQNIDTPVTQGAAVEDMTWPRHEFGIGQRISVLPYL